MTNVNTTHAIMTSENDRQLIVGAGVDQSARSGVFADCQSRRADNTLRHQKADLAALQRIDSGGLLSAHKRARSLAAAR